MPPYTTGHVCLQDLTPYFSGHFYRLKVTSIATFTPISPFSLNMASMAKVLCSPMFLVRAKSTAFQTIVLRNRLAQREGDVC